MKNIRILLIFYSFFQIIYNDGTCPNYNDEYKCSSNLNTNEWDNRCFQTPYEGSNSDPPYKSTYQDMHYLVGYAQIRYSSNKKICKIIFYYRLNNNSLNNKCGIDNYKIIFKFGEIEQESNSIIFTKENATYPNGLSISAKIVKKDNNNYQCARLELEKEYFIWDIPKIIQNDTIYEKGQKGSIVELFGWPYGDVAEECDFLSVAGYLGLKITPPNEYVLTENWFEYDKGLNPWTYFYQPVSYNLNSRLGNKVQLKNMIYTCRKKNIRIYAQLVINQMTYQGNDIYIKHYDNNYCTPTSAWTAKSASGGSPFFTFYGRKEYNTFTNKKPIFEYPAVPYCGTHFYCQKESNKNEDIDTIWIKGSLQALNTSNEYVRQRIADFFTELISIGISGFSIFNGKYISTTDYCEILKKFKENLGNETLPDDFIIIFELVITDDSQKNYLLCDNNNVNFAQNFTQKLSEIFTENDIEKIKIQLEGYPDNLPNCSSIWNIEQQRYVMSMENQDNQNNDNENIKYKISTKEEHINKHRKMFGDTSINSKIRKIFSSYSLPENKFNNKYKAIGFPDGKSDCRGKGCIGSDNCNCNMWAPYCKAYCALSTGYDTGDNSGANTWIFSNYTRVHRHIDIVNSMREWIGLEELPEDELYKITNIPTTEILSSTIISTSNEIDKNNDTANTNLIDISNITENPFEDICIRYTSKNTYENFYSRKDSQKENNEALYFKLKFYKFKVMKCDKLIFSFDTITKNEASILLLFYSLFYLIFLIIYIVQGIDPLIIYRILDVFIKLPENISHSKRIIKKFRKKKKKLKKPMITETQHICHHYKDKLVEYYNRDISIDNDQKKTNLKEKIKMTYKNPNIPAILKYYKNRKEKDIKVEHILQTIKLVDSTEKSKRLKKRVNKKYKGFETSVSVFEKSKKNKKENNQKNKIKYKTIKNPPKKIVKFKKRNSNDNPGIKHMKIRRRFHKIINGSKDNDLESNKSFSSSKIIFLGKKKDELLSTKKLLVKKYIPKKFILTNCELNNLDYLEAIHLDKRTIFGIYCSILKREQILLFIFFSCNDYNLLNAKLARFIFILYTYMAMNVLFFNKETILKLYLNDGKYDFKQNIPQILYSTIVTMAVEVLVCYLTLTDKQIYKVKNLLYDKSLYINNEKILGIYKCIKIKLTIYFIISLLLILLYWYFVTSFCASYVNARITLIINHFISKFISLIYPFVLYIIPAILRKIALLDISKKGFSCLYKISKIIPFF